jgi:hypothetical protein
MHSENFTALSRSVATLLPPVPAPLAVPLLLAVPVLLFSADPLEQPALITASMASAASGRNVLLRASPDVW